ncbi:STM3941 family protein [Enterococcus faecalis]|uniref:STM3941 family protein n=1 Tax=Enterococcus faecalis TaxID=1351 RepID=UPI00076F987D|nr:STM3941 family protein [Enterococcus faecalis]
MDEELIIYRSKLKQIGLSLLGFLMVVTSLAVLMGGLVDGEFLLIIIGLIGSSFFGFCEFSLIKQVFKRKPVIILNSEDFMIIQVH